MLKSLGVFVAASIAAGPCLAAPAVYGAMSMQQLSKVLNDERGIPNQIKNTGGVDIIMVDAKAYQQPSGNIQLSGLLCDTSAPPACLAIAIAEPMSVPSGAISDAQLLTLQAGFDFFNVHRLDATHFVVTMAMVMDGVSAQDIDTTLRFFSGQYTQASEAVAKLLPAPGKPH